MLVAALALLAPREAAAIEPLHDRWEHLDPRPQNEFVIQAATLSDYAGVNLGYRRALGRHLSLGLIFEYVYPDTGYAQLQGLAHTLEFIGWIQRPWLGIYFEASVTVGHNFLAAVPALDSVGVGGGASMGWSWDLPFNLNLGLAGGLRFMRQVDDSPLICTLPRQCVMVREEFVPRFSLTFGYRF